jgi:hypothetical protein
LTSTVPFRRRRRIRLYGAPTLEELVYSAAQRVLDQQSTALSDLRTRTSTLVAAATFVHAG